MFLSPCHLYNTILYLCTKTSIFIDKQLKEVLGDLLSQLEKPDKERKVDTELWLFVVLKEPQHITLEAEEGNPGQENTTL